MKILKNKKLIFGLAGFLTVFGITTLTILLVDSQDDSSSKQTSKTKINGIQLKANAFKISGLQSRATIDLKSSVRLPEKTELRYFVGNSIPTSDKNYTTNKPTTLKNGDLVYIKLFIKEKYATSYELKKEYTNSAIITITDLLIEIDTSKLNPKSFEFQRSSWMSIRWRSNVDLPKQVEVKCQLVTSQFNPNYKPGNNDYNTSFPISYNNENTIIYVKFFIKNQFKSTYQFPNEFQDTITFKNQLPPYLVNSNESTIFKDSHNNLWLLAKNSKLQVLAWNSETKQYATSWTDDNSELVNNSTITNGAGGAIFEDSKGNLWAMGKGSKLQVLAWNNEVKQYATSWTSDASRDLLNNSKITNGVGGTIFEDSRGNLWAMADNSSLQVLAWNDKTKRYLTSWTIDTSCGLLKNSNITNGWYGIIFEDSHGNLWAMGKGTKLQVLNWNDKTKQYATSWTNDNNDFLTNGSMINDGTSGTIFEDSKGNLWAMSYKSKLQVLTWNDQKKEYGSSWSIDTNSGLLRNSNIADGFGGTIFEDSKGNLWAMAYNSKLQVLAWNDDTKQYASSWSTNVSSGLLKGSIITNGLGGTIFEDSQGNLWAMSYKSKLQVLAWNDQKKEYDLSWIINTSSRLLRNSNVSDGVGGIIFEDYYGNIWVGSKGKTFQVFNQIRQKWIQISKPVILDS